MRCDINKMHLLALFLIALSALVGCSEKPPVRASYVPADCPTLAAEGAKDSILEPVPEDDDSLVVALNEAAVEADEEHVEDVEDVEDGPAVEVTMEAEEIVAVGVDAVDLNSATMSDLIRLPGVGPALARRILDYRAKRPFERSSDLQRVKGIGPAKYAKLQPLIRMK